MRRRIVDRLLVFLIVVSGAAGFLYAQGGVDTSKGSASIEVADTSGAIIQGATVTLTGSAGSQKASADLRGRAAFYTLAPGTYAVRVEYQGFRATEMKLVVNASQRSNIRIVLEPGAITETVQVTEKAATVDVTSTTTGGIVSQEQYTNIPIGRNISSLFSLAAGVSDAGADRLSAANPSISGSSGLENQYIIDGINATDQGFGAFGVWSSQYGSLGSGVNFDFVKEVQVKTGGFEAQYGQALGGVVNIVTDSGGNEIHGAAYIYTNPALAEAGYRQPNDIRVSSPQTEVWSRHGYDFGFNLGGPIKHDKLFWYGAFNPSYSTTERMGPLNFGSRTQGFQPWVRHAFNWVGKVNLNLTQNHRIEATAFADPSRDLSGVHRSLVRDDLDNASSAVFGTRNWAVKYSGVFGVKTLFNASFGDNHTYFNETPTLNAFSIRDYTKPKPNSAYTNSGGLGFMENSDGENRQYGAMLTRNASVLGGHQIDIGYNFNQVRYNGIRLYSGPDWALPQAKGIPASMAGTMTHGGTFYLYAPNTRSVGGTYYDVPVYRNYRGNYTDPTVGTATDYHNSFVQDAWQINRYITAKLGIRWEQQRINGNVNTYTFGANWAPRLGFIIDPTGSRKTKIFGNWGRFFEKVPQDLAIRSMSMESSYMNGHYFSLPPTQASLVPTSVFSPYGTDPTILYGGTKAQYQTEMVAGIEREVRGFVVSARFIHRNLNRIIEDISGATVESADAGAEQNFVITNPSLNLDIFHNPVACTGGPNCDPDTGFTVDSGKLGPDGKPDLFPDPRRVYKALELTVEKRFGSNWSLTGNYRLAKLFGNYEGLFRNDNEQADPNITSLFDFIWSPALADQFKVGPLPTDRRHVANIFGNYVIGKRLNLGVRWNAMSGSPLNKLLAHPNYGNAGEVPVGGRGAFGRSPFQNYWDLQTSYDIPVKSERYKLKASVDMLNLFDRQTATIIDQNYELDGGVSNAKDWLKPTSYKRPFYARFSLRFQF